jgi:signal transduction histidine kinase
MVASYVLERYARRVFAQQRTLEAGRLELEQQAGTLRETNDYLASAIAELREAQERLVQQEKLASLGALTAGIAHEIKNPLNFVNNFAGLNEELISELKATLSRGDGALHGESAELLDQIETNAHRIQVHGRRADGIVRSMLAHTRRGQGARTLVDFNEVVEEHLGLAYHGFRARGGMVDPMVERDFADGVGKVRIDPQEIGRVVINLASNAFDAVAARAAQGEPGFVPTVTVTTRREKDWVTFGVADNGPGLSSEARQRLFEPFFTTKAPGEGTGLGLSLAHEIVRSHGGTIDVENREGPGVSFVVRLPA